MFDSPCYKRHLPIELNVSQFRALFLGNGDAVSVTKLYFCHYLQKLMVCNVFYLPLMWPTDALWKVNLGQRVWYKQKAHLWPSAGMWLLSKGFLQLTVLFTKPLDCVPLAGMLFSEQSPIHSQCTIFPFCMEWLVTMELVALWISL